ncbi:hypothetical protein HBI69_001390 [Parastagonospora nodorum]|nr:hypothetical protein HBI69_001390 [Parastagonospora nodorum]
MSNSKAELPTLAGNWEQFSEGDVVHDQLSALKQYLAGKITADSCAQQISSTVPKAMVDGTAANDEDDSEDDYDAVYSAVYSIFTNLQHAAITNPQYQAPIITLLHAIKRLPTQTVHAPTLRKHADPGPEAIKWAELPNFSGQILDRYEYAKLQFDKSPSDHAAEWASINAWIARLVATDLKGPKDMDYFMHRASYNFLYVLDIRGHPSSTAAVPAAANLFRFAGPVVWRLCQDETPCSGPLIGIYSEKEVERVRVGGEVVFKGLGYSMERWGWWKERWGQLASDDGLGEDGKAHAREALEAMREAESSF